MIAPSVETFVRDIHKLKKVEEYAYRPELLMSVYVKIKAFELTRTINDVFVVVEFESEERGKVCKLHHIEKYQSS